MSNANAIISSTKQKYYTYNNNNLDQDAINSSFSKIIKIRYRYRNKSIPKSNKHNKNNSKNNYQYNIPQI